MVEHPEEGVAGGGVSGIADQLQVLGCSDICDGEECVCVCVCVGGGCDEECVCGSV